MRLRSAIKKGKLIDKRKTYMRFQMQCITDNKRYKDINSHLYHLLSTKEIGQVMDFYIKALRTHIENEDERTWNLGSLGYIFLNTGKRRFVNKMRALAAKRKEEASHEI